MNRQTDKISSETIFIPEYFLLIPLTNQNNFFPIQAKTS